MTDATCKFCGAESHDHPAISCIRNLVSQRDEARVELRDLNEAFCVLNDSHIALRAERDEARERIASALAVRLSPLCCDGENNGEVAAYEDGYREALSDVRAALSEATP
jgi:hypothetical protein